MLRIALLLLCFIFFPACQESPASQGSSSAGKEMKLHAVPTAAGLRVLLEASSAEVLHAFRPRARFEGSEIDISEQKRSFRVRLLLRYQVFFKPMVRTAEISFQILPDGTLGDCSFRDPVPRASTVLCPQRVKEGVFQALSR